ncbi:amidohydrolase [Dickeya sp. NCPPB 3274]|uniref:amidohydrolase n=1 Tax=Dickeya sp. NCPPB 3274 TaxID=568766 RepID=UPI0003A069C0|nr:amidohydrolase [Dickeya sp. NCPPB 3274]
MKDLTLSLVQMDIVWEQAAANRRRVEKLLKQCQGSDVIVLPEMFTTGFSMKPKSIAERMEGKTRAWMQKLAAEYQAAIVGSVIIENDGHYYNRLLWVTEECVQYYDKRHLFTYAGEHQEYTAGEVQSIVDHNGWRIALFICYDLRFPAWSRNLNGKYDAAIYIANWPAGRSHHWQTLLPARAIENQSYVIGVNRVGQDGNQLSYSGNTMLVDPLGETLLNGEPQEAVFTVTLSHEHLHGVRERFPFLKDADQFEFRQ